MSNTNQHNMSLSDEEILNLEALLDLHDPTWRNKMTRAKAIKSYLMDAYKICVEDVAVSAKQA